MDMTDNTTFWLAINPGDWLIFATGLIVAIGTLALAVMTFRSINLTRRLWNSEKRQRNLLVITSWAKDIARCPSLVKPEFSLGLLGWDGPQREEAELEMIKNDTRNLILQYSSLAGVRKQEVISLANGFTKEGLHSLVEKVSNNLGTLVSALREWVNGDNSKLQKLEEYAKNLDESSIELVKVASNIDSNIDVEGDESARLTTTNNYQKKLTGLAVGISVSIAAMVFSTRFVTVEHNIIIAVSLFVVGLIGTYVCFWQWRRL